MSDVRESWEDIVDTGDFDHGNYGEGYSNGYNGSDDFDYFTNEHVETKTKMLYNPDNDTRSVVHNMDAATQLKILQRPIVHEDDQNRTAYVPQVKILKRPGISNSGSYGKSNSNKQTPVRSLAEREVAYAEARKRIMGESTKGSKNSNNSAENSKTEHLRKSKGKNEKNGPRTTVERTPKGPDGGRGFSKR